MEANKIATESENADGGIQLANIASRTRSHVRIEDDLVETDLPDLDPSLYHNPNSRDNAEYREFLLQIYSKDIDNTVDTNAEKDDPTFEYNDHFLEPGWKYDVFEGINSNRNNRIEGENSNSNSLSLDNFNNANINQYQWYENCQATKQLLPSSATSSAEHQFKIPPQHKVRDNKKKTDLFTDPELARILNQQLRQNVQLLTQTYLLTKNSTIMRSEAEEAKNHLDSYLKIFENKKKPSNLLPAISIVNNLTTPKDIRSSIRLSWRQLPVPESVKKIIQDNPNVFIYPSLMPQATFSKLPDKLLPKKPKINFTINEDKLLAYALNEFKNESTPYAFIASLLMTAKTKTQISNHIKNIKRSPGNEDNPIKLYYADGQLPDIDMYSDAQLVEPNKEVKVKEEYQKDVMEEPKEDKQIDELHQEQGQPKLEPLNQEQQFNQSQLEEHQEDNYQTEALMDVPPTNKQQSFDNIMRDIGIEQSGLIVNNCQPQITTPQPLPPEIGIQTSPNEASFQNDEHAPTTNPLTHPFQDQDDLFNMGLDDLMAASTTISKTVLISGSNNAENNKTIKNLKLKKSMLNLMSHNFSLSNEMGDLIVYEFIKTAEQKLNENNFQQLLQLLTNLMTKKRNSNVTDPDQTVITIYQEICKFLTKINAPFELLDRVLLFLNLNQATKCSLAFDYLHWIRFFQFIQHVELYNDGVEGLEKKLARLVDALQKDDSHKIKLAIGNLINKQPFLKREFDSLNLDEKPHLSLFLCEEDFDDITEPIAMFDKNNEKPDNKPIMEFEHCNPRLTKEELSYASPSCPCKCHPESSSTTDGQLSQHCNKCNLKFMKGRMYLVGKIKPILAEWAYAERSPDKNSSSSPIKSYPEAQPAVDWTIHEDRAILEFCRSKAEQSEETVSFDTTTFEELVQKRGCDNLNYDGNCIKKNAKQIAERFNQLMDLYKDENSNNIS